MVSVQPRKNDRFQCKDLGDEFLAYDSEQDEIHVLNGTARDIYLLCDGQTEIDAIASSLCEKYGVESRRALTDIEKVLEDMLRLGLLTVDSQV
ncbi:MAG: PqqD family protein [Acidobacteriota bacterium]|nr:PqqD family protein [Acidobacteriota bacterium]MDH3784141.1 PqqD family protein [Acidobacteriota bacterium]